MSTTIQEDRDEIQIFAYGDDVEQRMTNVGESIGSLGFKPVVAPNFKFSRSVLREDKPQVVICEYSFAKKEWEGLEQLFKASPKTGFIVVDCNPSIIACIESMNCGAIAYLPVPVNEIELTELLQIHVRRGNNRALAVQNDLSDFQYRGIIGRASSIRKALTRLKRVAPTDIPVLILGENGTGKELAAEAAHKNSKFADGPFIPVHIGAITQSLIEGELFGWVRGAHSTATADKKGYIESANDGSLFLDEVGDIPLEVQAKLLRVLETKTLQRLGESGKGPRKLNFRLIAATNKDLESMCKDGSFREDLYYRIRGMIINLPPLRERLEDLGLFVENFVKDWNRRHPEMSIHEIPPQTIESLKNKSWNGNIRELKRAVEENALLSDDGVLRAGDLPLALPLSKNHDEIDELLKNNMTMSDIEKCIIKRALALNDGNRKKTAAQLQIPERTFYRKLKAFDLQD